MTLAARQATAPEDAPESAVSARSSRRISAPNVAIVGVTGAVGQEFLAVLEQRDFPIGDLKLLASARSAGKTVAFGGKTHTIEQLTEDSFKGVDLVLLSAGGTVSKQYAPIAVEAGAVVVDNSSAFRMSKGAPLVVPEVNPQAVREAGIGLGADQRPGIIANPNCSTIIMVVPVTPLHRAVGVRRMVVSTYQAASGAGAAAMSELEQQTREVLAGKPATCNIFPRQYAFNLFSHDAEIGPDGYNTEETKMIRETRKIWGQLPVCAEGGEDQNGSSSHAEAMTHITATCVRVPVMRAHAESINLTFDQPISEARAEQVLREAAGVTLMNDRGNNRFPTPLDATGRDEVFVGRIRRDLSQPMPRVAPRRSGADVDEDPAHTPGFGLDLFVCGDQLRKGAALNAVQIAELLVREPRTK